MHESVDQVLTPESPAMRVRVNRPEDADTTRSTGTQSILASPGRRVSMASLTSIPSEQRETGHRCGCQHEPDQAGSGAALLQRILESPGSFARQWNQPGATTSGFEILAGPGQPLPAHPLQGDILIRMIDGGSGHAAVVASPGLWRAEDLAARGFRADTEAADGFVHVTERGPFPRDASERFARGVTDRT